ncbi:hypothetical protein [Qipengyuania mesophila]|uniref:hypothetical protein n=1 Tax=Qipengyuania mesophila TaxID=2867246 RepID=UPI003518AB93
MKSSLTIAALASLCVICPANADDTTNELILVCEGAFRGDFKDKGAGGMIIESDGSMTSARGATSRYREIPTVAQFEMRGGSARLNLPQPPTCSICKGEKGWRDVRELSVDPDRITGKIRYGMFSATEFEIDRRTGIMTSRNGFTGVCEAIDLSKRKF